MSSNFRFARAGAALAVAMALAAAGTAANAAATLQINNIDGPGEGFNDPTPRAAVPGNNGATLGAQRLIAFTYAANIWGATLSSNVTIVVNAAFNPLTCSANSAVLGSAGATEVYSDFPGAAKPGTWYSVALANKLAGADLAEGRPQINAQFNSNLGQANCLPGPGFYLGLDGNEGTGIDLVATLMHEFGHGLGFQTFTGRTGNVLTGAFFSGQPSIWDHFIKDNLSGKLWADPTNTDALRAASAVVDRNLGWTGSNVALAAPLVLAGTPNLAISGTKVGSIAGNYAVGTASFGAPLSNAAVVSNLSVIEAQAAVPGDPNPIGPGCQAFNARNAAAAAGKIAIIDRGVCGFVVKVKNAQLAGAIGVVIADNAPGAPAGLGGADPTISIPSVRVSQADGTKLKDAVRKKTRGTVIIASLGLDPTRVPGTDVAGRPALYTPTTFAPGSSISHWDVAAFPNLLMEPAINADLTQIVGPPKDLTLPLFNDIGW